MLASSHSCRIWGGALLVPTMGGMADHGSVVWCGGGGGMWWCVVVVVTSGGVWWYVAAGMLYDGV